MDVKVNIKRYDPDAGAPASYWQEYSLAVPETATVLDALIQIREEMDGTLSLRCSCRSAICGSCAMRVNGHAVLACTQVERLDVDEGFFDRDDEQVPTDDV